MSHDLTGKIIIITGASSGIGAATAVACARAGMDTVLNARRANALAETAERVRQYGRTAELVVGDVTDEGMSARLLDAATEKYGRFDVVFANAGYGFSRPMHEMDEPALRRIFEVNFFAANNLVCAAARRLLAAKQRGHLLMCSSCVAKFTMPEFAAYSATKAAQNHVCRAMRMELRRHRIHVSSVHPITTHTDFFAVSAQLSGRSPEAANPAQRVPRWFLQTPEQVARAIVSCLRRPRPEVWTSTPMRIVAGLMTIFPRLMDLTARVGPR
ncbi:MAG: SDR family oxidoreductase [Planctomycetota bacterium]